MIAATLLDPGVYFAINSGAGVVGATPEAAVHTISGWGFPVTVEQMQRARAAPWASRPSSHAPAARRRSRWAWRASSASTFGRGLLAIWYHFAIMFEAVFILTTLDAGTRVGRFMLQDLLGHLWAPLGRTSWYPSVLFASAVDGRARGGTSCTSASSTRTAASTSSGRCSASPTRCSPRSRCRSRPASSSRAAACATRSSRSLPLAWLAIVTTTAAWQKITSADVRIGFFAAANDLAGKLAAGALPR